MSDVFALWPEEPPKIIFAPAFSLRHEYFGIGCVYLRRVRGGAQPECFHYEWCYLGCPSSDSFEYDLSALV